LIEFAFAGAFQFGIYGSGQQAAHAGDTVFPASAETAAFVPCAVGFVRAVLRHFDRTLCGWLLQVIEPLWLAPEQIRILTVSEKFEEYAKQVEAKMRDADFRVSCDLRGEKIGSKIRDGRHDLVPYLAVVGAREADNNSVALRSRKEGELGEVNVDAVVEKLAGEVKMRGL
jgi:threonyl-tRNA synthetase